MTALSRLGLTSVSLCRSFTCSLQWHVRFISDVPFQEKKIDVFTARHLFPKHTDKGLNFEVTYIDEKPPQNAGKDVRADDPHGNTGRLPVALLLHGSPGSYVNFKSQVDCLVDRGLRVLAPNFPDLQTIRQFRYPAFRNTPLNKSVLIRDFLKALGISKVDLLVTHSSGTYTGLRLYRSSEVPDIDAFAMINPAGHWHTCTNPRWFYQSLGELVHWRLGYGLFSVIGMWVFPLLGPVDVPNIDEPLLALTAIRSFNLKEVSEGLQEVRSRRPPLLFTFSENDKLIGRKVSYSMLKILGCDREDWWMYDDKGQVKSKGRDDNWIRALSFEAGSHYSFRKHPEVINASLLQLFEQLPIAKVTQPVAQPSQLASAEQTDTQPLRISPVLSALEEEENIVHQPEPIPSSRVERPVDQDRKISPLERAPQEPVLVQRLVTNQQRETDKHSGEIYQEKQKIRL